MSKVVLGIYGNSRGHWVGDGFPVRTLFSSEDLGRHISPFLLLDYAGPHYFEPTTARRGVKRRPHRGFETVTIVYEGQVEQRDATGNGGVIGPGDAQLMTAASGTLHEEFHGPAFREAGGLLRMVKLSIDLPARHKLAAGGYQAIPSASIPIHDLRDGAGKIRVIAGEFNEIRGPARTFIPIDIWDLRLSRGADILLDMSEGNTALLVVLTGTIEVAGKQFVTEAEMALLSRQAGSVRIRAEGDATVLVLGGTPNAEPIAGHGPFVMNCEAEIR